MTKGGWGERGVRWDIWVQASAASQALMECTWQGPGRLVPPADTRIRQNGVQAGPVKAWPWAERL